MPTILHSFFLRVVLFLALLNLVLAWGAGRNGYDWSEGGGRGGYGYGAISAEDVRTDADTADPPPDPTTSAPLPTTAKTKTTTQISTTTRETTALKVLTDTQIDIHTIIVSASSPLSSSPSPYTISQLSNHLIGSSGIASSSAVSVSPAQSSSGFKGTSNANVQAENAKESPEPQGQSSGSVSDAEPDATISLQNGVPKLHDVRKQVQFGTVAKMGSAACVVSSPLLTLALLSIILAIGLGRTVY